MTELEKVEKLREKADVSFLEAKGALEASNGDILDALIFLETQGKVAAPAGGGYYSGAILPAAQLHGAPDYENSTKQNVESFGDMMKRFFKFCLMLIHRGNTNFLEASKGDERMFTCPVTVVIIFMVFFFWVTVPLFVISLFFGLRYHFRGADLGRDSVNHVMDSASDMVDDVKKSFHNSYNSTR